MLDTQPESVSPAPTPQSRGEQRGHPYRDLQSDASKLAIRLEMLACAVIALLRRNAFASSPLLKSRLRSA